MGAGGTLRQICKCYVLVKGMPDTYSPSAEKTAWCTFLIGAHDVRRRARSGTVLCCVGRETDWRALDVQIGNHQITWRAPVYQIGIHLPSGEARHSYESMRCTAGLEYCLTVYTRKFHVARLAFEC